MKAMDANNKITEKHGNTRLLFVFAQLVEHKATGLCAMLEQVEYRIPSSHCHNGIAYHKYHQSDQFCQGLCMFGLGAFLHLHW